MQEQCGVYFSACRLSPCTLATLDFNLRLIDQVGRWKAGAMPPRFNEKVMNEAG